MAAAVYSARQLLEQLNNHILSLQGAARDLKAVVSLITTSRNAGMAESVLAPLVAARYAEIEDYIAAVVAEISALNFTHQIVLEAGRPAQFTSFGINDTAGKIVLNSAGAAFSDGFNSGLFAAGDHMMPRGFSEDDLTYPDNAQIAAAGTDDDEIYLTSDSYTVTPDHSLADNTGSLTLIYR